MFRFLLIIDVDYFQQYLKVRHPVDRIISDFHYRRSGAYLVELKEKNPEVISAILILTCSWLYEHQYLFWIRQQDWLKCPDALAGLWPPEKRLWKLCLGGRPRVLLAGGRNLSGWGGCLIKLIGMMLVLVILVILVDFDKYWIQYLIRAGTLLGWGGCLIKLIGTMTYNNHPLPRWGTSAKWRSSAARSPGAAPSTPRGSWWWGGKFKSSQYVGDKCSAI